MSLKDPLKESHANGFFMLLVAMRILLAEAEGIPLHSSPKEMGMFSVLVQL